MKQHNALLKTSNRTIVKPNWVAAGQDPERTGRRIYLWPSTISSAEKNDGKDSEELFMSPTALLCRRLRSASRPASPRRDYDASVTTPACR